MTRVFSVLFVIGLVSCQTTQQTVPVNYYNAADDKPPFEKPEEYQTVDTSSNTAIWVSNEYKVIQTNDDDIQMFVNDGGRWLPRSYLVINKNIKNEGDFKKSDIHGWGEISHTTIEIADIQYVHNLGYFKAPKVPNGIYHNILDDTPYSAPKCSLVSDYHSLDGNYSISFIDPINCSNLSRSLTLEEDLKSMPEDLRGFVSRYTESMEKRLYTLENDEQEAFGFL